MNNYDYLYKVIKNNGSVAEFQNEYDYDIDKVVGLVEILNSQGYDIRIVEKNSELYFIKKRIVK